MSDDENEKKYSRRGKRQTFNLSYKSVKSIRSNRSERIFDRRNEYVHCMQMQSLYEKQKDQEAKYFERLASVEQREEDLARAKSAFRDFVRFECNDRRPFDSLIQITENVLITGGNESIYYLQKMDDQKHKISNYQMHLDEMRECKLFINQVGEDMDLNETQVMTSAKQVLDAVKDFERRQIGRLEVIEEQETSLHAILKKNKQIRDELNEELEKTRKRLEKQKEETSNGQNQESFNKMLCAAYEDIASVQNAENVNNMVKIRNKLSKVHSKVIENKAGIFNSSEEMGSLQLLADIEKLVFDLLDQIERLPKKLVRNQLDIISRRRQKEHNHHLAKLAQEQKRIRLEKILKRALEPVFHRSGKPLMFRSKPSENKHDEKIADTYLHQRFATLQNAFATKSNDDIFFN